ncbi:MAG TPA: circularly permuted type 2 ATP-grasp protein [Solirubrobacterales bacterium]|nr:circularly permuted type 2 ATP-grasp protein [Solirubrobacterales bacterium]
MPTTPPPARPFPGADQYPLDPRHYDEAFAATGAPRHLYAELLGALAQHDLGALRERVRSNLAGLGVSFAGGPFELDPVPRLLALAEWQRLRDGLLQRARALNAFVLDVYGPRRIFDAGVVPRSLLAGASGYEPEMDGLLDPAVPPAAVAGLDLVRGADGELRVLEDNLRMPSGSTYALAAREAAAPEIGATTEPLPQGEFVAALGAAIRAAAPDGRGDPGAAILSDGPASGAYYEQQRIGGALDIPVVEPGQLEPAKGRLFARLGHQRQQVTVLYRRTDEDRLSLPGGGLTQLGELLLPALRAGRLGCLNAFGTGVADDKLAHPYAEEMVRFYLDEQPLLRSVPSYDLTDPDARAAAMGRLDDLVVKPRDGFGGEGVTIMARANASERRRAIGLLRRGPERFVAQEMVELSSHPTVCGERLEPRRVDLRPFVVSGAGGRQLAMTGGLTRYAREAGEMIVNSSRGGGCKDTWVVDVSPGDEAR